MRAFMPRFAGDNLARNEAAVRSLHAFAADRQMTPAQLLVAWVLAKQPTLVPVIGARSRAQVDDVLGALDRALSAADVSAVEALLPADAIAGTRYAAEQMKHLDSER
jgi:aryl-alcohol dehydrogenase-like predicted oxidoreductase